MKYELIKYRDAGMHTYTFFWVDEQKRHFGPFFNTEEQAKDWMENETARNEF